MMMLAVSCYINIIKVMRVREAIIGFDYIVLYVNVIK